MNMKDIIIVTDVDTKKSHEVSFKQLCKDFGVTSPKEKCLFKMDFIREGEVHTGQFILKKK